jgi:DNA-binding transcriptional ArsR family regulator
MDAQAELRQPPRAVDLRRSRAPEVDVVACDSYDLLLALHVILSSPDRDYVDYAVGQEWMEAARAKCAARDPTALETLGRYLGSLNPASLHATLLSLVAECPQPNDAPHFLDWLAHTSVEQLVEALLDQDGLGDDWPGVLAAAVAEVGRGAAADTTRFEPVERRFAGDARPTVARLLREPEQVRAELVGALRDWYEAVFRDERPRVLPALSAQVAALDRQRAEMPLDRFIKLAMHGVEWQRPVGLRRIIFAPSYFCRPAVFYHFWRGVLTFCMPVDAAHLQGGVPALDPRAPSEEILGFFEALGDQTRLRILRLLSEREMYLTELADRLELTKATTKHHMVKLRAAQLVTLYDRDRLTYYAIVPNVQRRAAGLLGEYLSRSDARPVAPASQS